MDRNALNQMNGLYAQYTHLAEAVKSLESGGKILSLQIGGPGAPTVSIQTADVAHPQQATDAIKAALVAKRDAIKNQLAGLGLTGDLDQPPVAAEVLRGRR